MLRVTSSRRAAGLKPSDYDHEIVTLDNEASRPKPPTASPGDASRVSTRSQLIPHDENDEQSTSPPSHNHDRGDSSSLSSANSGPDAPESRVQERPLHEGQSNEDLPHNVLRPSIEIQEPTPNVFNGQVPHVKPKKPQIQKESVIDILYENERGGFVCGVALFSSQALGGLDPTPWTNAYHRPSPTDIHTAQVPDPSWEWAWSEWHLNLQDGMDESGWEYSFAFQKKFSWHGPKWYNSFVRRRAWTRKRVRKSPDSISADPHMPNSEYFTIRPASERLRTSHASLSSSRVPSKTSMTQVSSLEPDTDKKDIEDMDMLLHALRVSRIDREKLEAVESYLEHAIDLGRLEEEMHTIMSAFIFQASRRLLLSHMMQVYDETSDSLDEQSYYDSPEKLEKLDSQDKQDRQHGQNTKHANSHLLDRSRALQAAIKHADEEVRRLAYWSDVKHMAQTGESTGAVEGNKGWKEDWEGLDDSGPVAPNMGKLP
jgi:hypothetical protein